MYVEISEEEKKMINVYREKGKEGKTGRNYELMEEEEEIIKKG